MGLDISIQDLAEMIASIIDYKGEIIWDSSKPDGTPRKLLDISKLSHMGWKAKTSLKKGIKLTTQKYIEEVKSKSLRI